MRRFISTRLRRHHGRQIFAAGRPTVVLCIHQATRTGAPIVGLSLAEHLSKNINVVCVLLQGGELLDTFANWTIETICPIAGTIHSVSPGVFATKVLRPIMGRFPVDAVLVNSAETAVAVEAASSLGLPNVCLVHEFAQSLTQQQSSGMLSNADLLVFSSRIQRESFIAPKSYLPSKSIVLAQGKCAVPEKRDEQGADLRAVIESNRREDVFLCIGCGYIHPRKGVDLFIAAAAKLKKWGVPARFLWVGDGFLPSSDPLVSLWLKDQIERGGLQEIVTIIPAVGGEALQRIYDEADAMFLSSRLDPLPNVAIDAIHAGLPVVCFDKASGIAEAFEDDDLLRTLVVPYYDIDAAADTLGALARNVGLRNRMAERLRALAAKRFDMGRYAKEIERLLRLTANLKET
ncbi:glycosyltransferase family 4 protein [Bradyrhizobium sp. 33ap4]|uniref:glycosyltransferase family 4 protein n=1 Tax=Bradyrhizobium sp. 33ap4 TaxID=3061630 RepID=UPI00293172DF|nr:glycosyltransferase family 4 protein [Bradyrhizobium sp. 33ap4]